MAGYWPSSFLACLWAGTESVHKLAKNERTQDAKKEQTLRDAAGGPERAS